MASERGFWLRDQTSARFGACWMAGVVGSGVTWAAVSVLDAGTAADSNWRAVVENDRCADISWRDSLWAARSRETYIVGCGWRKELVGRRGAW